jgi:hypothetical protein
VTNPKAWEQARPTLNKRERSRRKALHELLSHIAIGRDTRKGGWSERDHLPLGDLCSSWSTFRLAGGRGYHNLGVGFHRVAVFQGYPRKSCEPNETCGWYRKETVWLSESRFERRS